MPPNRPIIAGKVAEEKPGLIIQHTAAECRKHRRVLEYAGPLLQQNEREDDSEERRHFIKNVCICQYEMVNRVVIAENAEVYRRLRV